MGGSVGVRDADLSERVLRPALPNPKPECEMLEQWRQQRQRQRRAWPRTRVTSSSGWSTLNPERENYVSKSIGPNPLNHQDECRLFAMECHNPDILFECQLNS
jgi:hypothetical protein